MVIRDDGLVQVLENVAYHVLHFSFLLCFIETIIFEKQHDKRLIDDAHSPEDGFYDYGVKVV